MNGHPCASTIGGERQQKEQHPGTRPQDWGGAKQPTAVGKVAKLGARPYLPRRR